MYWCNGTAVRPITIHVPKYITADSEIVVIVDETPISLLKSNTYLWTELLDEGGRRWTKRTRLFKKRTIPQATKS